MKECIDAVNDIEYFLSRQNAPQNDLGAISMVIHEQYNAFIRAANTVAELHGRIDKVSDKSEEYNRMVFGASVFRSHASTRVNSKHEFEFSFHNN